MRTRPRAMDRPFLAVGVSSMSEEDVGVDAALLLLEVEVAAVLVDADVVVVSSVAVNINESTMAYSCPGPTDMTRVCCTVSSKPV